MYVFDYYQCLYYFCHQYHSFILWKRHYRQSNELGEGEGYCCSVATLHMFRRQLYAENMLV